MDDRAQQALTAKQLGSVLRQQGSVYQAQSREMLVQALQVAQEVGLKETEAGALGELALLNAAENNVTQAIQQLNRCIEILHAIESNSERWEHELTKLRDKQTLSVLDRPARF